MRNMDSFTDTCPECGCEMTMRFFHPIKTNADRIRAMSDEELAEWMATKVTCMRCPVDLSVCQNAYYDKDGKCDRILLDWIKSPAEEVDNG